MIKRVIDPTSAFEKKADGQWARKPGVEPSNRPIYILGAISACLIVPVAFIIYRYSQM